MRRDRQQADIKWDEFENLMVKKFKKIYLKNFLNLQISSYKETNFLAIYFFIPFVTQQ